jgi:demethylmenaquinone methyltransferase/2-methoxy-6-polyprenyl-1,4-benzoquinol methylase
LNQSLSVAATTGETTAPTVAIDNEVQLDAGWSFGIGIVPVPVSFEPVRGALRTAATVVRSDAARAVRERLRRSLRMVGRRRTAGLSGATPEAVPDPARGVDPGRSLDRFRDICAQGEKMLMVLPSSAALDAAAAYERRTYLFDGWRDQLIERLAPREGDTVLDVSCGPGLNLAALRERVGPRGLIIGIEDTPELLEVARHRVRQRGWRNVRLLPSAPTPAELPSGANAALLSVADDVLQSPARLTQLFNRLRPGARVAAGGWKLPSGLMWPLRFYVKALYGPLTGTPERLDQPWRALSHHIPDLTVGELGFGTGYLAHGTVSS